METCIPSELDNETYLKYEKVIKNNNISTIFLIKDKSDIKENTYIGDETSKVYVTKSLIDTLPINEYFSIVCLSRSHESCKTYKLLTLNKLLDEEDPRLENNNRKIEINAVITEVSNDTPELNIDDFDDIDEDIDETEE